MDKITSLLNEITKNNNLYKIKLRYRKNPNNSYRLYLDYWDGDKRSTENLKLYVYGSNKNLEIDKNTIRVALEIRQRKETKMDIDNPMASFLSKKEVLDFIAFFQEFAKKKKHANYRVSYLHFKSFKKTKLLNINKVDYELCERYRDYLLSLNISNHTAKDYFVAFKATLNYAVKLRKIKYNPAGDLTIRFDKTIIERLTFDELKILYDTECKYDSLKYGFIFACYTGLRISDIRNLKFSDIVDDHISIMQKKTRSQVYIKLNKTSERILTKQKKCQIDEYVFHIPQGGKSSKRLKEWVLSAGIRKKITFHCSRHTFGCLLIENGIEVFAVKKLMGHRDIRTTLQYVDKVDTVQDEAIDKLPIV